MSEGRPALSDDTLYRLLKSLVEGHAALQQAVIDSQNAFQKVLIQFMNQLRYQNQALAEEIKFKPNKPHEYDGSSAKYESFRRELWVNFEADPKPFRNARARIAYALSYMSSGKAEKWANRVFKRIVENRYTVTSWEDFEKMMEEYFADPNARQRAKTKISTLKQERETVDE